MRLHLSYWSAIIELELDPPVEILAIQLMMTADEGNVDKYLGTAYMPKVFSFQGDFVKVSSR